MEQLMYSTCASQQKTRLLFGIAPIESRASAAVACGLLRFDCRPDSHPGGAGGGGGASAHGVLEVLSGQECNSADSKIASK